MTIYENELRGGKTKAELDKAGTLFAQFRFVVQVTKRRSQTIIKNGNDTSSNVSREHKQMHVNAYKDAKSQIFSSIGGSKPFTVQEIDYYYIYRESLKGFKHKKTRDLDYYNDQIPDTERTITVDYRERKLKEVSRTQKKSSTRKQSVSKMKQDTKNKKSVSGKQKSQSRNKTKAKDIEKAKKLVR